RIQTLSGIPVRMTESRVIQTMKEGPNSAKILYDYTDKSYKVEIYIDGTHDEDSDYHAEEESEALAHAQTALKRLDKTLAECGSANAFKDYSKNVDNLSPRQLALQKANKILKNG